VSDRGEEVHSWRAERTGFGLAAGLQRWRSLLFMHWEAPAELLGQLVPRPLTIDTYQGKAFVGLIPFDIPSVRPLRILPPVPTAARFLETNLRTYVRLGDRPGVWFFSLDAGSTLAVLGARGVFGLPYFRATMAMTSDGSQTHYSSQRLWPPSPHRLPASLEVRYQTGDSLGPATPGTLEHFLVERYVLYARHPLLGLLRGEVRHRPYPLRKATVTELTESLTAAAGIVGLGAPLPALFSEGVDVDISRPMKADSGGPVG
jgi:uncharacterized protein YqjF (DUF2071 family)